jgi:hypothetical protein
MMAGLGIVQAALIRNLGRPDWWFWYQAASKFAGLAVIAAPAPLGLDAMMTGLVLVVLCPLAPSVRQACRMLSMSLTAYARSFAARPRDAGHGDGAAS